MAIQKLVCRVLGGLMLVGLIAGCSNPESHPLVEPPPVRDGTDLDRSATHITTANSPYIVRLVKNANGDTVAFDWIIPEGQTVTVDPGVEIMFDDLTWVDVAGKIVAEGTPEQPIKFNSARLQPDLGDWRGFKLRNEDPGQQSVFRFCEFTWGAYFDDDTLTDRGKDAQNYRGMLAIRNSSPIIQNCVVFKNQNNAVFIAHDDGHALPRPTVQNSILNQNDGAAVRTGPGVELSLVNISYNLVGDNSIPAFLLYQTDSTFGYEDTINRNLDSTDIYFNLDRVPEMVDPLNGDFTLTSCSPGVDAGSDDAGHDPDGTQRDLGARPYTQVAGELRGVWGNVTLDPGTVYRMSCHVRVPQGQTLTIPAGTRIEATGLYNLEVFGRLDVQGTADNRVHICPCQAPHDPRWGGLRLFNLDTVSAPSVIRNATFEDFNQTDVFRPGVQFDSVMFDGGYIYGVAVGTFSTDMADTVSFRNCTVTNCGSYGIASVGSAITIRNTLVQNVKGRGISLYSTGTSVEISNTIARACSTSGIVLEEMSSPLIVNTVMADNGYHGLHLINNCLPVVMNSIIYGNHLYGVNAELSSTPQLSYNNIAGNGWENLRPADMTCTECISLNPLFGSDGTMRLDGGSPSVNAGNPDPAYNDVDGSRNDQGAYGGPAGLTVGVAGVRSLNRAVVMR